MTPLLSGPAFTRSSGGRAAPVSGKYAADLPQNRFHAPFGLLQSLEELASKGSLEMANAVGATAGFGTGRQETLFALGRHGLSRPISESGGPSQGNRLRQRLLAVAMLAATTGGFNYRATAQTQALIIESRQAQQAMITGDYARAIKLYRGLVHALPNNVGLVLDLGLALHSAGRYREAVPRLEAYLRQQPGATKVWFLLGLDELHAREPQQAAAALAHVVKAEPDNNRARLELSQALMGAGHLRQALSDLQELTRRAPQDPRGWQALGLCYVALSQQAFHRLENQALGSAYWDALMGHALLSREQFHTAFTYYRRALRKNPTLVEPYRGIVKIYQNTGHNDWAAIEQARMLRLSLPACGNPTPECDFLSGNYERVVKATDGVKTPKAYYWSSLAFSALAKRAFLRLTQMPSAPEIYALMAEAYRIQGRYDLAVKMWRKALAFKPGDRYLEEGLARALWLDREYRKALPILEDLVKSHPESFALNFELGDTLLHTNSATQAMPFLEKAAHYEPTSMEVHAALGRAYMQLNQPNKAIPHFKLALNLDDQGTIYYQLAQAYQRAGDHRRASRIMKEFEQISAAARERLPKSIVDSPLTPP